MTSWTAAVEAELHGLVDGQIDAARRAGALRRLAASPSDRARVEAWQAQNDLLRSAFAGVEREPVPAMLDLRTRPQLHCIPAADAPLVVPPEPETKPRRSRLAIIAAIMVATAGLLGSWNLLIQADPEPVQPTPELHGTLDADLTIRAVTALGKTGKADAGSADILPTARIPDLGTLGFRFVGAETDVSQQPPSIQFRYRSQAGERIVLSVMRAGKPDATPPSPTQGALRWRTGDKIYAMASTVDLEKLRAIASTVQAKAR